ncbi:polyamine ABC transporter substrate-binding protein [Vibrio nitrifigilis]
MKKGVIISLLASLLFVKFATATELNIYLWEDTLSKRVINKWNESHNVKLNLYHFDNDDERSLLMLKSLQLPFDIVVLDNISAHLFSRQNVFENLKDLPNRKNNLPRWNQACGTHAIPYFWGSVGIAYRKSKVDHIPTKWNDVVQMSDKQKGHVGMIQDSVETLLPALYSLDYSPITDNENALKQAYQKMLKANPNILTFEYLLSYVRSHKNSDKLHLAVAYSGDQYSLNRFFGNDDWDFVTPDGEPYLWIDCMAINSNSHVKKEAKEFLEFLMDPEIAKINALDIRAATPNTAALKILPKSYVNDKSIFPPAAAQGGGLIDSELSPANLNVRAKIINSIINQHEAKP